jgi:hypothetical protein
MSDAARVTRTMLSAPLPQIIERLGIAIAEAQSALDRNSIAVAEAMASTDVELGGEKTNLIALGFTPAFYSFTEATVEAKLSFSMQESTEFGVGASASVMGGVGMVMVGASVSVSYSRKFQVSAEGMSSIAARLVSLPAPEILETRLKALAERPAG